MSNFSLMNFYPYNTGYSSTVSVTFTDQMFWDWKTFMIGAGWTVIASGDGISAVSIVGDVFTSKYKGVAGGLGNPKSWFIIREPGSYAGSQRQLLIVKSSADDSTRFVIYSQQGFVMGTGHNNGAAVSAVNPPMAYDEIFLSAYQAYSVGANYVPSNFYNQDVVNLGNSFNNSNAYSHQWNESVSSNKSFPGVYYSFYATTTAPYCFYIMVTSPETIGGIAQPVKKVFIFDELINYQNSDDPLVMFKMSIGATYSASYATTTGLQDHFFTGAWYKKSVMTSKSDALAKTVTNLTDMYVPVRVIDRGTSTAIGSYEESGKDMLMPAWYVGFGNEPKLLGESSMVKIVHNYRNQLQTVSVGSTRDNIVVTNGSYGVCVPWDGSSNGIW